MVNSFFLKKLISNSHFNRILVSLILFFIFYFSISKIIFFFFFSIISLYICLFELSSIFKWSKLLYFIIIINSLVYYLYSFFILLYSNIPLNDFYKLYIIHNLFIFLFIIYYIIIISINRPIYNIWYDFSTGFFSLYYLSLSFLCINLLYFLDIYLIIFVFSISFITDITAYYIGGFFVYKKNITWVSPNKTLSGFIGAWVCGVIFSLIWLRNNSDVYYSFFISLVLPFCSIVGDLLESFIKRIAGVSDSSNILYSHGGLLDRMDSVFFTAIFYSHLYSIYYL